MSNKQDRKDISELLLSISHHKVMKAEDESSKIGWQIPPYNSSRTELRCIVMNSCQQCPFYGIDDLHTHMCTKLNREIPDSNLLIPHWCDLDYPSFPAVG